MSHHIITTFICAPSFGNVSRGNFSDIFEKIVKSWKWIGSAINMVFSKIFSIIVYFNCKKSACMLYFWYTWSG